MKSAADRQYDEHRFDGVHLAAAWLEEPYPAEVFTPMTDEEIKAAVAAMNEAVPHASERMHAAWSRHWAGVLRKQAKELKPS
jgi:hypothetical protein